MEKVLSFDRDIYSLDVIKKSAYRFSSISSVTFKKSDTGYDCIFELPDKFTDAQVDTFVSEFKKNLLDQDLREIIRDETETTRNLILAHAFSNAGADEDEQV